MENFEYQELVTKIQDCKTEQGKLELVYEATKNGIVDFDDFSALLFYCF